MNWEDSNACTPLKRDFLHAWFAEERRFFLTGGSALGLFYLDHRRSYDLDFFSSDEVGAKEVQNLVHRIAARIGAECHAIQSAPDFHRFRLVRGEEREIIDVVVDLYFLEQAGHDILSSIPDAQAKDGGWDPAVVSMLLDGMDTSELPPWLLRSVTSEELDAFSKRLRLAIADKALPPS